MVVGVFPHLHLVKYFYDPRDQLIPPPSVGGGDGPVRESGPAVCALPVGIELSRIRVTSYGSSLALPMFILRMSWALRAKLCPVRVTGSLGSGVLTM